MKKTLDPKFLDILVCPITRSKLTMENNHLISQAGGLKYPIRDGIPILLAEQAVMPAEYKSLDDFKAKNNSIIPKII
ncbi:hypothetical protein KS4_02200 [Poriferisphaera corsica]|uniref:UPF0434 protein KS4_02200 n=1 Tax=Poriferisphaera corsica TaxID=2528020 RepID=A0A517YPP3_9BACT|nr:Trm112 family protein [Poriferisphaera corsica]QDU32191.1 hypothetical protein KS4_02200 [Poriferisphaera corsica]